SDDQLRARARVAVHGAGRATRSALRYGLQSLPFVSSVALTEPPTTAPGTLRVDVALAPDNPANRAIVNNLVDELRPVGIYVERSFAERAAIAFDVALTLTGASQPASVVTTLQTQVRAALTSHVGSIPPGGALRAARLSALVLQVDDRIADAAVGVTLAGAPVTGNVNLPSGQVADTPTFTFRPTAFADASSAEPASVVLTAQLRVALLGGATLAEARSGLRTKLDALLTALQAGEVVTFQRLLAAARNDGVWVVQASDAVFTFTRSDGTFAEIDAGGGTYTTGPGELSSTGALDVEEAS
ncbi:MAG TPA: baseplate J/gp47 family protein, partial [Myxococcota bacterium]|nr:baseplate J/gp47 family protein [Myxococcota bacterium]